MLVSEYTRTWLGELSLKASDFEIAMTVMFSILVMIVLQLYAI